jgi:putative DNA primase/helicase
MEMTIDCIHPNGMEATEPTQPINSTWPNGAIPTIDDPATVWLNAHDPSNYAYNSHCHEDRIKILLAAVAKGVPQATAELWLKQSGKFDKIAFNSEWQGAVKKLAANGHNGLQAAGESVDTDLHGASAKAAHEAASTALVAMFNDWANAPVDHAYLVAKNIPPDGLKIVKGKVDGHDRSGWLAIPVRDLNGEFCTAQLISPDGDKLNVAGASFSAGMHVVGEIQPMRPVYVVEGIGQAHACIRANPESAAAVTFSVGRTLTVAKALRDEFPSALRIVIVADKGQEATAEKVAREVNGHWVEMPADAPANADVLDLEQKFDTAALAALLKDVKTPNEEPLRYNLQSMSALKDAPPVKWMMKGVLPDTGLAELYGVKGAGKSALLIDFCAALARGVPWCGHRVPKAVPVTYVCLEGGTSGLAQRVQAWCKANKVALPEQFRFTTQPFDLRKQKDVEDLCAAVTASGGTDGLIVIDTLARASRGTEENSNAEMGLLMGACETMQHRLGGVVLVTHHAGKDPTKGSRGASSMPDTMDCVIELSRKGDAGEREWCLRNVRNGPEGERHAFKLTEVPLGLDEDNDEVTGCTVTHLGETCKQLSPSLQLLSNVCACLSAYGTVTAGDLLDTAVKQMDGYEDANPKQRANMKSNLKAALAKRIGIDDVKHLKDGQVVATSIFF